MYAHPARSRVHGQKDLEGAIVSPERDFEQEVTNMEMKRLCKVIVLALCCLAAIGRMSPLQVSENGRFLVEDAGKPFFILADTAWTLFSGISRQDVQFYLDDRKAKGFNTILCGLLHFDHTAQAQWLPKHRVYGFPAFDGNSADPTRNTGTTSIG